VNAASEFSTHPIIRKLESIVGLSDEERDAVLRLPMQVTNLRADQDIVREGDRPSRCCAVLEGFCSTYTIVADGKRQIMAFHIPGDIPDLQSLHLRVLDVSLGTMTPCKVGFIQHEAVRDLCARHPRLAGAFWRETLIDASIFREWMASLGRREAYARIAHLFCEMVVRLRSVGLVRGDTCDFPITQAEIGDALGLSYVHVNRTLQELRSAGLITLSGGTLKILDWETLQKAGDFEATYLHLEREQAAA
jgi:CRP-like cAMP-binding protein